jgi:DNA-binding CsgD family transcriptional regulator
MFAALPVVSRRPGPSSPAGWLWPAWHRPMLALHAATEVESLWRAVLGLLRAAVAPHRVTLFLGHIEMGEARMVFTDPPVADVAGWYSERGRINPFSPFIAAHRGVALYRFEDVLPPRDEFLRSDFYRRFARPEGWDKGVSVLYWRRGGVKAMFSVYRAPEQPPFDEHDVAVLRHLRPFIGTAIDRVRKLHHERQARRGLEEFNKQLPVGIVVLDWDLRVVFANAEGWEACALWNSGPQGARSLKRPDGGPVPAPVLAAVRRLREELRRRDPKQGRADPPATCEVAQPGPPELRAMIAVADNPTSALARPRFQIVFATRGVTRPRGVGTLAQLRALSPREREIALLVPEGLSNAEIARRLGKSVLTVKTQLNAVFRKLGLKRRTQLVARLQ